MEIPELKSNPLMYTIVITLDEKAARGSLMGHNRGGILVNRSVYQSYAHQSKTSANPVDDAVVAIFTDVTAHMDLEAGKRKPEPLKPTAYTLKGKVVLEPEGWTSEKRMVSCPACGHTYHGDIQDGPCCVPLRNEKGGWRGANCLCLAVEIVPAQTTR